ncbi:Mu transposase C-terminal domain-containing protein [Streptomyces sp. NBC_01180]|uniref:Mu transposase C-terminal domain-containing protein n=1 Tax=Streptomyces sp. NBC_01180 TaxID=2903763 RepID=UPI0038657A04|nr:Mu transposase C-terminal domain-containing protein [Streptomyces sp. NBC_01180]
MTTVMAQATAAQQDRMRLGARLRWQGGTYRVVALQGAEVQLGCLDERGHDARALVATVVGADDYAVLDEDGQAQDAVQVADTSGLSSLSEAQLAAIRDWERHLREIDEGVPPDAAEGTVPRPGYDPERFTVGQRIAAKAAELKALGFKSSSVSTIERRRRAYQARGVFGLVRDIGGSPWGRTDERVVRLLLAEIEAGRDESDGHGTRLYERLQTAVEREHPDEYERLMVSRATFYRLLERLGISVDSLRWPTQRRMDAANGATPPYTPTWALRLGEQVQIDSTGLDIIAVGDDGRPVQVELTAAIDVASRSIIGAMIVPKVPGRGPRGRRLGGRGTRSFDAVLMLAQALAPMPGRPGWSSPSALAERSEMPYADLVACDPRMAGAAARPVIRPRMIVVDHGKVFNSEHFDDVCRMLGINVRPARTRTATDKAVIESTFGALKKRFSQYVAGYTGSDLARRGKHVMEGPLWSLNELQDLLDEWIALDWQQTPHDGLRSPFLPGITISPNRMYATLVAAEGHVPLPLTPHENRKLLPFTRLKVTDKGVTINNRTYNSEALQEYRNRHSQIPGQGMKWQIRYSPYAPRLVWLYDHTVDDWVEAEFIHQRLISDAWTQWTWEQATLHVLENGGHREDQRRIAREVSALREHARRGPDPRSERVPQLFTGPALDLDVAVPDPYEGVPDPDPATVVRAPSLALDAEHILTAGDTTPPRPPAAPESPQQAVPALFDNVDDSAGQEDEQVWARPPGADSLSLHGSAADIFTFGLGPVATDHVPDTPTPHCSASDDDAEDGDSL